MRRLSMALGNLLLIAAMLSPAAASAQSKLKIVATFSILGDLVSNVGGDRVEVVTLVGPDGDAHVYSPSPTDARRVADAKVMITNGLKFDGWINRLVKASGTKATVVEAAAGISSKSGKEHRRTGHGHAHSHGEIDPHAWQSVDNVKLYVATIRDALVTADPPGRSAYEANAAAYLQKLDALDKDLKTAIAQIPADRRKIITSHDAFGYFEQAYGLDFVAPQGVSTEAEASAKDVARIIQQIKKERIGAVFSRTSRILA